MLLLKILKTNPPPPATTSNEYVDRIGEIESKGDELTDLATLYTTIKSTLANSETTTETTITNLAQMHINLSVINLALEKRIPFVQKNCMKQIPSIIG